MKKAIVIICIVVLLLSAWGNASLLPEVHQVAQWILLVFGVIIAALLTVAMMDNRKRAAPGLVLFFSIALLNVVFLFVVTHSVGNFLLGGFASIFGLLFSLQDLSYRKKRAESVDVTWDGTETYDANPDLELPQMLDSVPQNEPQVEVELETYTEPVIALGNEKVRRAKTVKTSSVSGSSRRGNGRKKSSQRTARRTSRKKASRKKVTRRRTSPRKRPARKR